MWYGEDILLPNDQFGPGEPALVEVIEHARKLIDAGDI